MIAPWNPAGLATFALLYAAALVAVRVLHLREFKRAPGKGQRYRALPLRYKLMCWFVVLPLFAGGVLHVASWALALVAWFVLEVACIRWYRKAGLFP